MTKKIIEPATLITLALAKRVFLQDKDNYAEQLQVFIETAQDAGVKDINNVFKANVNPCDLEAESDYKEAVDVSKLVKFIKANFNDLYLFFNSLQESDPEGCAAGDYFTSDLAFSCNDLKQSDKQAKALQNYASNEEGMLNFYDALINNEI